MDPDNTMKTKFIAAYDYGMGGVWFVLLARSKQEIMTKFRDLVVFDYEPRPEVLSVETYEAIKSGTAQDIDATPTGALAMLLRE